MFDAIVVGARCGGASAAMLLARQGHRVLVVDRASFPSDTLSTHFVWPRGTSYLNEWGVLPRVLEQTPSFTTMDMTLEDLRVTGEVPVELLRERFRRVHRREYQVVQTYCSVRRSVLDELLLDEARRAGAEVRTGFHVEELLMDGGRVTGIRGSQSGGSSVRESARLVIGADGRNSFVASALQVPKKDPRPKCSFAYFTYYSGVKMSHPELHRRGRMGLVMAPTTHGQTVVLVFGPAFWFDSFLKNAPENFLKAVSYVSPRLGEQLRDQGQQSDRFFGTNSQQAWTRQTSGPGWMLVGDAASLKDQCTAIGMTHAFRDAALAAESAGEFLSGARPWEEAAERYSRIRYLDTIDYYNFVASQAEMNAPRMDEVEVVSAVQGDAARTGQYLATFGDTLPVRRFFSRRNLQELMRGRPAVTPQQLREHEARMSAYDLNPFEGEQRLTPAVVALSRTPFDYARVPGKNVLQRIEPFYDWMHVRQELGLWPNTRFLDSMPGPTSSQTDELRRACAGGVNYASQDYLSLASHPAIHEAATRAIHDYGPHSAGSPMGLGNTELSRKLERALAELVGLEHVLLFPTGWAAGFGSIYGLMHHEDHVLLDKLTHNCLAMGARAAVGHVERYDHLDVDSARYHLRAIRERDSRNAIMVVTEGLFSMESDSPRILALQEACREYDATLLLDVAHDLGASGPGGTGQMGLQGVLGKVDLVMGSFSKTFVSNGGFLASNSPAVKQYVKHFAGSHTFSNGLSPAQAAAVLKAVEIVRSPEGEKLRGEVATAIGWLRDALVSEGVHPLGQPSPIVPVIIGDERLARVAHKLLFARNVAANCVEFPIVESGMARFRLQVMARHTQEHARFAARAVAETLAEMEDVARSLRLS